MASGINRQNLKSRDEKLNNLAGLSASLIRPNRQKTRFKRDTLLRIVKGMLKYPKDWARS